MTEKQAEYQTTVCDCETCLAHRGVNDCHNCANTSGDSHACGLYAAQTDECLKGPGRQYWERRETSAGTVHDDGLSDREKLERYLEKNKNALNVDDMVNHPAHYTSHPVETIEIIKDVLTRAYGVDGYRAYCLGNELKYRLRAGLKGEPVQDIEKAMKYLEFREGAE